MPRGRGHTRQGFVFEVQQNAVPSGRTRLLVGAVDTREGSGIGGVGVAPLSAGRAQGQNLGMGGRIVNLSSAAQVPVSLAALAGEERLSDNDAYAQSKLALTMWTRALAARWGEDDPLLVAVNPGSLLASKMVRDAYGMQGKDIGIGADILTRAALSDEFASASGQYFDNDRGRFADSHPDALDPAKVAQMMDALEGLVAKLSG